MDDTFSRESVTEKWCPAFAALLGRLGYLVFSLVALIRDPVY